MNPCKNTDIPMNIPCLPTSSNSSSVTTNTNKVAGLNTSKFTNNSLLSERQVKEKTRREALKDQTPYSLRREEHDKYYQKVKRVIPGYVVQMLEDIELLNTCGFYSEESQYK